MDESEEWRVIFDFPKYMVSSLGRIQNVQTQEIRKSQLNHRGMPTLVLYNAPDPSRYIRQVNQLVATAFCDTPQYPDMTSVWHNNGDLSDCRARNLKWESRARVLEWNEMHRTGQPRLRTPQVMDNRTGRVYTNAFECGLASGEIESAVAAHIERYPPQYVDQARWRYVDG